MDDEQKNYYEILEIHPSADNKEITQGYIKAKNAYSPDSPALYSILSTDECSQMMSLVEEAYEILGNPLKKRQYDEARGLNKDAILRYQMDSSSSSENKIDQEREHTSFQLEKRKPSGIVDTGIGRIVAKKKFTLDFTVNEEFEQEIEQTVEFTGQFLRKVREYKNVNIVRMADMTKVSKTYLTNIEEENIDKLPALVYVRGFVYQYAKCLKLSPEIVANSYLKRIKAIQEERKK
jgi:DnaJ-class molecular chaperone